MVVDKLVAGNRLTPVAAPGAAVVLGRLLALVDAAHSPAVSYLAGDGERT